MTLSVPLYLLFRSAFLAFCSACFASLAFFPAAFSSAFLFFVRVLPRTLVTAAAGRRHADAPELSYNVGLWWNIEASRPPPHGALIAAEDKDSGKGFSPCLVGWERVRSSSVEREDLAIILTYEDPPLERLQPSPGPPRGRC